MKLTREQVEEMRGQIGAEFDGAIILTEKHMNALCDLALTALSAEPVAWRSRWKQNWNGEWMYGGIDMSSKNFISEPLFTAPPSLLAENAKLREALEAIAGVDAESFAIAYGKCIDIARAALRERGQMHDPDGQKRCGFPDDDPMEEGDGSWIHDSDMGAR